MEPPQPPSAKYNVVDFSKTAHFDPPLVSHPTFSQRQAGVSRDWREYQHPIGSTYFYNPTRRILTADNVRDPDILQRVLATYAMHTARIAGDPLAERMPPDVELVVTDGAVRSIHSRGENLSYHFDDTTGLREAPKAEFWAHMMAFPAHHYDLPRRTESAFAQAVRDARAQTKHGVKFEHTESQINAIMDQYRDFLALREQGLDVTALLSWLIGMVMPLEPVSFKQNN